MGTPLRVGDSILEINGIAIIDQDQKEVQKNLLLTVFHSISIDQCFNEGS